MNLIRTFGLKGMFVLLLLSSATPSAAADIERQLSAYRWQGPLPDGEAAMATLRERLIHTLVQQPGLLAQRAQEQEAVLRIDEVRAQRRPQVNIGLEQRNSLDNVNRNAFDSGNRLDAVASVTQLLYDFGVSGQRLEASYRGADAARWQSQAEAERLVLEGASAHLEVLRFRVQSSLADDNLGQHEEILADVIERAAGGAGSQVDVLRAESRLAEAHARRVQLHSEAARVGNRYQELFQRLPQGIGLPALAAQPETRVDAALAEALQTNAELNSQLQEVEASRADAQAERLSQLPRLSVSLQGRQFDIDQPSESESDLSLLFQVDYAPYTGGAASSRTAQAQQRAEGLTHEREAQQRDLEARLRSAFTDQAARQAMLEAQSLSFDADRQALVAYREQFSIGRRNLNDLLDAQRDLFQSAVALVDQRIEWELARYRRLALVGQLLTTLEIAVEPHN